MAKRMTKTANVLEKPGKHWLCLFDVSITILSMNNMTVLSVGNNSMTINGIHMIQSTGIGFRQSASSMSALIFQIAMRGAEHE